MIYGEGAILKRLSYHDLKEKSYPKDGDTYKIVSGYFIDQTRDALLTNPSYDNDDCTTVLNMVIYNGEIIGRHMMMPTRIKIDDKVVIAQTGGGHEIHDNFQGMGFGTLVVHDTILNSEYPIYIGQLYSTGAISILKKMDLCIFGKPLYNKNHRMRSVLVAKGYSGLRLTIGCVLGDIRLRIIDLPNKIRLLKLKHKYVIKRESIVPDWVEEITLHDGHRYTEVHDKDWLQWNLNHVFSDNPKDNNFFYAVYDKNGKPAGFYMTKERFEENKKGTFKDLMRGTVVEWGSYDETVLTEFDLNIMALSTFSRHIDKINTVISSENSKQVMKKLGYEYRGMYQMTFKKTLNCDSAMQDQENWRIRYGGCNTILV